MPNRDVLTGNGGIESRLSRVEERVQALDRLLEAKFVRVEAMIRYEADKVALALTASDKAITKAETATEKRLESVNEFRSQLADQAKTFLTRDTFDTFANLSERDRADLHRLHSEAQSALQQGIASVVLSQTTLMTRDQVMDALKLVEAQQDRSRDDINAIRRGQTRMTGMAIGVSVAISAIGTLMALILRLASGQ